MKAVVFLGDKTAAVVDRPVPKLQDHYLLVKPVAVALNPTDLSHILMPFAAPGCIMGCDYAGIVEEVGSKVTKEFKKGDRVCGFSHGGNISQKEEGTFAEHIVCIGDLQMKIPDSLSFEQAATLGVSVGTVGQGLFEQTGLELAIPSRPTKEHETVMVYGGSTATGGLGIQLLKAAGYKVITTCSSKNLELVKSLGADEIFDYRDPECAKKINEYTDNKLKYCWDTVGNDETAKFCAEALSSEPGCVYGTIMRGKMPREDVKVTSSMLYDASGEDYDKHGFMHKPGRAHFHFAKSWTTEAIHFIRNGTVKTHPVKLGEGGLQGVLEGFADLKKGTYGGQKLVYRVEDTMPEYFELTL